MNGTTGFIWFLIVMWLAWRIFVWYQRRRWDSDEHWRCPDCGRYRCPGCGHDLHRQVFDEDG
jgi:hypothetical protein